jgi:type II secretory pathway pseudopilin PulG
MRSHLRFGFSLVEVALSLGIAGLALVAMAQGADDANRQVKDAATADRISQVYTATQQYLTANPGLAATMTAGTPVKILVGRTSSTGTAPAGSLQALGFLPADFVDSNPYGQTHAVVLRAEGAAPNTIVEALVQTVGGTTIRDVDLGRIAAKVGANGGVVDTSPPPGIAAGTMQGTGGGWSEAATAWTASGLTPSAGHAIAVSYATQTDILQPWLYRNAVPGQPEANRMHTAIDMQHNALNAVASLNNTDTASGAAAPITVNSTLQGTSGGKVMIQNGLNACLGNATGCELQISDDGGFTDLNDGWVTYVGSGGAPNVGLHITGAGTSNNLLVDGNTTTSGVTVANGGLVAQNYIQSYGDVQMKRTATHLAALTWPDASGNWSGGAYVAPDNSEAVGNLLRLYNGNLKVDGSLYAANGYFTSVFSNIYYDATNTDYYMQPASNSNLDNVYTQWVYDYGNLAAESGNFNVYKDTGGNIVLYLNGRITTSGEISSSSDIVAGTTINAGSSITAGSTVTGNGGVITGANGTLGGACTTGEIGRNTTDGTQLWCNNGSWTNTTSFTRMVQAYQGVPSSAWVTNSTNEPELISAYTVNGCLTDGIAMSGEVSGPQGVYLTGNSQGFNANMTFVVPPQSSWEVTLVAANDGTSAPCTPNLTVYYTGWR